MMFTSRFVVVPFNSSRISLRYSSPPKSTLLTHSGSIHELARAQFERRRLTPTKNTGQENRPPTPLVSRSRSVELTSEPYTTTFESLDHTGQFFTFKDSSTGTDSSSAAASTTSSPPRCSSSPPTSSARSISTSPHNSYQPRVISPIEVLWSDYSLTDGYHSELLHSSFNHSSAGSNRSLSIFTNMSTNSTAASAAGEPLPLTNDTPEPALANETISVPAISSTTTVTPNSPPPSSTPIQTAPSSPNKLNLGAGSSSAINSRRGSLSTLHAPSANVKMFQPTSSFPFQPIASPVNSNSPPTSPNSQRKMMGMNRSPLASARNLFPGENPPSLQQINPNWPEVPSNNVNSQPAPSSASASLSIVPPNPFMLAAPPLASPNKSSPDLHRTTHSSSIPPLPPLHARLGGGVQAPFVSFPYFLQQQHQHLAQQQQQQQYYQQHPPLQLSPNSANASPNGPMFQGHWDPQQMHQQPSQYYAITPGHQTYLMPPQSHLDQPHPLPSPSPPGFISTQPLTVSVTSLPSAGIAASPINPPPTIPRDASMRPSDSTDSLADVTHLPPTDRSSSSGSGDSRDSGDEDEEDDEGDAGEGADESPAELMGERSRRDIASTGNDSTDSLIRSGATSRPEGSNSNEDLQVYEQHQYYHPQPQQPPQPAQQPPQHKQHQPTPQQPQQQYYYPAVPDYVPAAAARSSASAMRKAASAADFKSYNAATTTPGSSRRNQNGPNLGVLTTFYNNPTALLPHVHSQGRNLSQPNTGSLGGSGNASTNSLSNLRSNSHAMLAAAAATSTVLAAPVAVPPAARPRPPSSSSSSSVPPLIPQFSLGSFVKYDGQPRKRRHEIAMVTDKLRDMQYEIGRLSRKIKEYEEDTEQWTLRYSRRLVILSNISLGCWIFLLQFLDGLRTRTIKDTAVTRLFIPRNILALAASKNPSQLSSIPLSSVLISGFLTGIQSSVIFILSAMLQIRTQSWKRNAGFLLSTCYSLYLVLLRRREFRPHITNWFNIFANLIYVSARYYFLHGLLVFNDMRIL